MGNVRIVAKKLLEFGNNLINMKSSNVRPPAVADMFYPGSANRLKQMILEYLEKAKPPKVDGRLKGLIVPHAGYIYSGPVAAYSYKLLRGLDPDVRWKILLLGPSHQMPFSGAAAPIFDQWKTPLGLVDVKDIREEIKEKESIIDIPGAGLEEHSLEVQVPFLQMVLKDFVLYPLVLGNLRSDFLANDLLKFCKKDDVIVIVSTDLSHYMEYGEAKKTDLATSEAVCDIDVDKMIEIGDACGKTGVLTLMYIAKELGWKCKLLDYRNSGDTAGTKDQVVGYGAFAMFN